MLTLVLVVTLPLAVLVLLCFILLRVALADLYVQVYSLTVEVTELTTALLLTGQSAEMNEGESDSRA